MTHLTMSISHATVALHEHEAQEGRTSVADWGRTVVLVLVLDQEVSVQFYREALGAHVIHDSTVDGFRCLHVGIGTAGLWLIAADDHSAASVGRQTAGHPLGVVYVSDVEAPWIEPSRRVRRS